MTSTAPWALAFGVVMYSFALFGLVVIVVTFLRIARTLTRIHQRLDEILTLMRSK